MPFLSATLGLIAPRWRSLRQWSVVYQQIIEARPLAKKTLECKRCAIRHVLLYLGERPLCRIRPHEIAAEMREIHSRTPVMARSVLIVLRDMMNEAINYGWLDRNPAANVKQLSAPVARQRLTLEQWQQMREAACQHRIPWIVHLLELVLLTGQRRADLCKMRFDDVWDDHLHVRQQKTSAGIALPLALRLDAVGMTLREAIESCRSYGEPGPYMLRSGTGAWQRQLNVQCLSNRFEDMRAAAGIAVEKGTPPSLHECRSLAERLYREQGIDTRTLLGHKRQAMTDVYNDDRGLSRGQWRVLTLP